MDKDEIDSLDDFIDNLCLSLAKYVDQRKTGVLKKIEIYNTNPETFYMMRNKILACFWLLNSGASRTSFSYRESSALPEARKDEFYINTGQFLELYEKRKARGENFRF